MTSKWHYGKTQQVSSPGGKYWTSKVCILQCYAPWLNLFHSCFLVLSFVVKYSHNYQWLKLLLVLNILAVWINKFCLHLAKISKDLNFLCTIFFLLNYREKTPDTWSLPQLLFLNTISMLMYVWQETVNSLLMSQLLRSFHRSWRNSTHSTHFQTVPFCPQSGGTLQM